MFLFLSGFAISPTLIASFAWIEEVVPPGRLTEGITLFTTGLGAGLAPGAALVGVVADRSGASSAFWVTVAGGLIGAAIAFLAARLVRDGS
jgi:predicted MFS family arabinose efflux permease